MGASFFIILLPIVLYVIIDAKYGMKAGIYTAMASMLALIGYFWFLTGELDYLMVGEAALLTGLGFASIRLQNSHYFKFQPVILNIIMITVLAIYHFGFEPLPVRYIPMMIAMSPEAKPILESPAGVVFATNASLAIMLGLFVNTLLVGWGALKLGNIGWMITKISVYPIIIVTMVAVNILV